MRTFKFRYRAGDAYDYKTVTLPDDAVFMFGFDCTAFNGTVVAESDGTNIKITPEITANWIERYTSEVIIVTALD